MQTVLNIIAIAAFVMSLFSLIVRHCQNHTNLNTTIKDYSSIPKHLQFFILFENKSRLPVAITAIYVLDNGEYHCCHLEETRIKAFADTQNDEIKYQRYHHTAKMPIEISTLGAAMEYFEFRDHEYTQLTPGTAVTFRIHTNRGILDRTLILGKQDCYLRNM